MKCSVSILAIVFASAAFAQEKITYNDHIRPIFNTSCVSCHNPDKNKAGLSLTSYQSTMAGSSNGKILEPGDPDGSLIYLLVTHQEEPNMPPKSSKLADAQLDTIKKWIAGGALESSGSSAIASAKPKNDMKLAAGSSNKPTGSPAMPKSLSVETLVRADREAVPGALAASPWAPLVAVAAQQQILLYHTQTRELLGVLPFAEGLAKVLQFSRNGSVLLAGGGVGGQSGKVALYDVVTGRRIAEIGEEYDEVLAADISPDQSTVALGGPGKVLKIYSTSGGSALHRMTEHTDWVTAVAYSPDGVLLASGDRNGGVRVWEAATGNEFYTLPGHKASVTRLSFRADSNVLASTSEDGATKLWDMTAGKEIKSWTSQNGGSLFVDFAPDGRLVTAGRDKIVRMWDGDGKKLQEMRGFSDVAVHAVFADQGALVIADDFSGQIRIASARDGKPSGELEGNPPAIAERIVAAKKQLGQADAVAAKATKELVAPQAAFDNAAAELQAAKNAVTDAKKMVAEAQATVASATSASTAAAAARDAAVKDLAAKQAERDRLAQVRQDAQAKLESATTALDGLKQTLEQKKQATAAEAEIAAAQQALDAKAAEVKPLSDAVDKAQEALQAGDATLAAAKQDVDAKKLSAEKAAAEIVVANALLEKSQSVLPPLETKLPALEDKLKASSVTLAKVKTAADTAQQAVIVAQANLNRANDAQVTSDLAEARQQLADLAARQEQIAKALKDLDAADKAVREAPQRVQSSEAAQVKAKEAAAGGTKLMQTAQAVFALRESLAKQSNEMLKALEAAVAKEPQNKSLSDAAAKAKESLDLINADLASAKQNVATTTAASKKCDADLAAADTALAAAKTDVTDAPKRVEQAKAAIAASTNDELSRLKSRVDQLSAEQERLQKQPAPK